MLPSGAVTTAHNAITATATSAEINCRGFNAVLVHVDPGTTGTVVGSLVYNQFDNKLEVYDGAAWLTVAVA